MVDTLTKSIENLKKLSPKLNEVSSDASAVILRVEKFLNEECGIGLAAESHQQRHLNEELEANKTRSYSLAYERFEGKYKMVAEVYIWNTKEEVMVESELKTAWVSAPRDVKLKTFPLLPSLLEEIARIANNNIEQVAETSETVNKVLVALGDKPKKIDIGNLK